MQATRFVKALAVAGALALVALVWPGGEGGAGAVPAARAQSVSLLSDASVELRDIGRLEGTSLIYVEFADGARCVAAANGGGDLDCDW